MPSGQKKLIKIAGVIFTFCFLSVILVHLFYSEFPETTKKTDANILTIEGFLPEESLEKVKDEFQHGGYDKLIVTGLDFSPDYCQVSMDGFLIFYPKIIFSSTQTDSLHIIEADAYSELGGEGQAHFNFFVNKSLIADFTAIRHKKKYAITWKGKLEDIDSVMIQFDNDRPGKWGDRNLYVKEIIIDNKIVIPYRYNSVYDIGPLDGKNRIINNFSSNAGETRNKLIMMGIDSTMIVAVAGEETYINRTLKIALAFRDWLKASEYNVKGINIMSFGQHARRKWMIYDKILGKDYNVGMIYFSDNKNPGFLKNIINELREFFGLVYYRIILIFY